MLRPAVGSKKEVVMKRALIAVLSSCLLLWTIGSWAQGSNARLRYAVDPATTIPSATVVQNSEGVTVVLFRTPAIHAGDTFTFRLDLTSRSARVNYPVTVDMQDRGDGRLDAAFDPAAVFLNAPNVESSTQVTVTVAPTGEGARKLKTQVKAEGSRGSHLGKGPGVKVVVIQGAATAVSPEDRILRDVRDALAPDCESWSEDPRPE